MTDASDEFRALMDATGFTYTIDDDGDARLEFFFPRSAHRTQYVWVEQATETWSDLTYRHVWSYIAEVNEIPRDVTIYDTLLRRLSRLKLGALVIRHDRLVYRMDISVAEGARGVRAAAHFAAELADEFEELITGGKDAF